MPADPQTPISYLQLIITALSGGVAGSALTLIVQTARQSWNRPILETTNDEEGCDVQAIGWLVDYEGKPINGEDGKPCWVNQCYLRLKLSNRGNTFAKDVSACVTKIAYTPRSGGQTTFKAEVFDLKLALTKDRAVFNLASKGHRFIDLVHSQDTAPMLQFDFVTGSSLLSQQKFGPGSYVFDVSISAENAASISRSFKWVWDGKFDGLKFAAVGE